MSTAVTPRKHWFMPSAGLPAPKGGTAVATAFIVLLFLSSLIIPLVWPFGPNQQNLDDALLPPIPFSGSTFAHPLGTDSLGRDLIARLASGGATSLTVSVSGVLIAAVIGIVVGMIAGYARGAFDFLTGVWIEVWVSFPGLLMAVLFLALVGGSGGALIIFLGLSGWMVFARSARAGVLGDAGKDYVLSAISLGASPFRVLFRHIGPNLLPTLGVIAALELAQNMLAESALSFLGLGIQPPAVSWGLMLAEGRARMGDAWWLVTLPGLAIMASVLSTMTLAEAARRRST